MAVTSANLEKLGPPRKRAKRIKGLTADARALGISRYFLWMVVKGFATSKPLLERYNTLKRQQGVSV